MSGRCGLGVSVRVTVRERERERERESGMVSFLPEKDKMLNGQGGGDRINQLFSCIRRC